VRNSKSTSYSVRSNDELVVDDITKKTMGTIIEDANETSYFNSMIRQASIMLTSQNDIDFLLDWKDAYWKLHLKKVIKVQSLLRMRKAKTKYKTMRRWASYRRHVLVELRDSERLYVNDLRILTTVIDEIKVQRLLTTEEINKLFLNVE
jgi:hypothetical protein